MWTPMSMSGPPPCLSFCVKTPRKSFCSAQGKTCGFDRESIYSLRQRVLWLASPIPMAIVSIPISPGIRPKCN